MSKSGILGVALALAALALFGGGWLPAAADGAPTPAQSRLEVSASQTETQGQVLLSATLTTGGGEPLSNRPLAFYRQADFFGTRQVYLGTGTTDGTGQATLSYRPGQPGNENVKVVFAGDSETAATEASLQVEAGEVAPSPVVGPAPLAAVGGWLTRVAGVVAAGFWLVLLGVLFRTTRGIRGAARAGHNRTAGRTATLEPVTTTQEGVYGAS